MAEINKNKDLPAGYKIYVNCFKPGKTYIITVEKANNYEIQDSTIIEDNNAYIGKIITEPPVKRKHYLFLQSSRLWKVDYF